MNWSDEDLRCHLEEAIEKGEFEVSYTPLTYEQMMQILQDNELRLTQFWSHQQECYAFDIVNDDGIVRGNLGLLDVETFIYERGLKRKITIQCDECHQEVAVQATDEGGEFGWTRYSYECGNCGHVELDVSIAVAGDEKPAPANFDDWSFLNWTVPEGEPF